MQAALALARYDLAKRRPPQGSNVSEEDANKRLNYLRQVRRRRFWAQCVTMHLVAASSIQPRQTRSLHACHLQALTLYKGVLKEQPSNIFAANGIGVCLAESSMLEAARETFTVVQVGVVQHHDAGGFSMFQPKPCRMHRSQEASAASAGFMRVPDVFINLANVHLARTDYVSATKLYEQASRLHHGRNTQVQGSCTGLWASRTHDVN